MNRPRHTRRGVVAQRLRVGARAGTWACVAVWCVCGVGAGAGGWGAGAAWAAAPVRWSAAGRVAVAAGDGSGRVIVPVVVVSGGEPAGQPAGQAGSGVGGAVSAGAGGAGGAGWGWPEPGSAVRAARSGPGEAQSKDAPLRGRVLLVRSAAQPVSAPARRLGVGWLGEVRALELDGGDSGAPAAGVGVAAGVLGAVVEVVGAGGGRVWLEGQPVEVVSIGQPGDDRLGWGVLVEACQRAAASSLGAGGGGGGSAGAGDGAGGGVGGGGGGGGSMEAQRLASMARAVLDEPAEAWRASAVLAALRAAGPDAVGGGAGSAPAVAWPPAEDERPSNALAAQVAGAAYAALGRLARADPSRAQRLALGLAQVRWLDESGRLVGQRAAVGGALAPVVPGAVGLGLLETVGDPAVSAARAVALAAEGERWVGERLRAIAGQGERVRSGPALSPEPPGLPIGPLLGMESSLAAWWEGAGGAGGRALVPAAGFGGLVLRDDLGTIAAGPVGLAAAASAGGSAAEAGAGGRGRWWVYLEEPAGPGVGPGAWRVTVDGREVRSGAIQRRVAGPDAASARRGVWIALPEGVGAGGGAFGLRIERLGPGGERLTWPGSAMPWAEAHTEEALIDPGAWDGLR